MDFEIEWQVDDGYAGASRPQSSSVNSSDFEGMSLEEIKDSLDEIVTEDFNQNISWFSTNLDAVAAKIFEETPAAANEMEGH